jgi:hypothetical protein
VFMDYKTQYCKMLILLKFICTFTVSVKMATVIYLLIFDVKIDKWILKCMWKGKQPGIAEIILKKNKVSRLMLQGSKTCYRRLQ